MIPPVGGPQRAARRHRSVNRHTFPPRTSTDLLRGRTTTALQQQQSGNARKRGLSVGVNARVLFVTFGLAVLFAGSFLANRNLYDDEIGSLVFMRLPYAEITARANTGDVHPPGQYWIGRLAFSVLQSPRWSALLPTALQLGGLAVFVSALLGGGALRGGARWLFAGVAFLHPQVMMWGTSLRWQSSWTGIVLAAFALGLSLHREPREGRLAPPSVAMCFGVGVSFAAALYINYLAVLAIGLFAAGWWLRFPASRASAGRLAIVVGTAGLLFVPQLGPLLTVHLPGGGSQVWFGIWAAANLLPGAFVGQAIVPWHPLVLTFGVAMLPLLWLLCRNAGRHVSRSGGLLASLRQANPAWFVLFALCLFVVVLATLTGLGRKARNFVFLGPMFAYLLATTWSWITRAFLRRGLTALLVSWIGLSGWHLLSKTRTWKGGFNDRHDEVIDLARTHATDARAVFFSIDPGLAFAIHTAAAAGGQSWVVCGPTIDRYHEAPCDRLLESGQPVDRVFIVNSYAGSYTNVRGDYLRLMAKIRKTMYAVGIAKLSFDPDANIKRRLPGPLAPFNPNYRYKVHYGPPGPHTDLSHFAGAYRSLGRVGLRAPR